MSPALAIRWPVNGVVMNNNVAYDQINPKIVSDGIGGGIMAWEDFRTGLTSDIYAQRVDSNRRGGNRMECQRRHSVRIGK